MINKRFYNYQTTAGHDIKVVMDDDKQHVMIDIRGYLERNLYFPEFVDILMMIKDKIEQDSKQYENLEFGYLPPLKNKTAHAIRCYDNDKAFILMVINENLRVQNKFVTQYRICAAFIKWLEENYRTHSKQNAIDIELNPDLISDELLRPYRI